MIKNLIDELSKTWPTKLKLGAEPLNEDFKSIKYLVDQAERKNVSSLPYFGKSDSVLWITFGIVPEELHLYADGLVNWLPFNLNNSNTKNRCVSFTLQFSKSILNTCI